MTELTLRTPAEVMFGNFKMYCERMKLSAALDIYETPNAAGDPIMTGKCPKMMKMTFSGRVYSKSRPLIFAVLANRKLGSEGLDITYRDIRFTECVITGFSAEDVGEDHILLTVDARTTKPVVMDSEVT